MLRLKLSNTIALLLLSFPLVGFSQTITSGLVHTCMHTGLSTEPAYCWGLNSLDQLNSNPNITDIESLDAGAYHTCALYRPEANNPTKSIYCWGDPKGGKLTVPAQIINPIAISVGDYHACAIYAPENLGTKVECWPDGRNTVPQYDISNPFAVYAGNDYTCVMHKVNKIYCWGALQIKDQDISLQPEVKSPTGFTCRKLSFENVRCWSNRVLPGSSFYVDYKENKAWTQVCELSERHARCTNAAGKEVFKRNDFISPWMLSAGSYHVCILDEGVPECSWTGGPGHKDSEIALTKFNPDKLNFGGKFSGWKDLETFIANVAESVYPPDGALLNRTMQYLAKSGASLENKAYAARLLLNFMDFLDYPGIKALFLDQGLRNLKHALANIDASSLADENDVSNRTGLVHAMMIETLMGFKAYIGNVNDRAQIVKVIKELKDARGRIPKDSLVTLVHLSRRYFPARQLQPRCHLLRTLIYQIDPDISLFEIAEGNRDTEIFPVSAEGKNNIGDVLNAEGK